MKLIRANIKNLIQYLQQPDPSLSPIEMCKLNRVSLSQYYRWKSLLDKLDKNEVDDLIRINGENDDHSK